FSRMKCPMRTGTLSRTENRREKITSGKTCRKSRGIGARKFGSWKEWSKSSGASCSRPELCSRTGMGQELSQLISSLKEICATTSKTPRLSRKLMRLQKSRMPGDDLSCSVWVEFKDLFTDTISTQLIPLRYVMRLPSDGIT